MNELNIHTYNTSVQNTDRPEQHTLLIHEKFNQSIDTNTQWIMKPSSRSFLAIPRLHSVKLYRDGGLNQRIPGLNTVNAKLDCFCYSNCQFLSSALYFIPSDVQ